MGQGYPTSRGATTSQVPEVAFGMLAFAYFPGWFRLTRIQPLWINVRGKAQLCRSETGEKTKT